MSTNPQFNVASEILTPSVIVGATLTSYSAIGQTSSSADQFYSPPGLTFWTLTGIGTLFTKTVRESDYLASSGQNPPYFLRVLKVVDDTTLLMDAGQIMTTTFPGLSWGTWFGDGGGD